VRYDTNFSGRNKFKWPPQVGDVGVGGGQAPSDDPHATPGGCNHHFLLWKPQLAMNSVWCIDGNGGRVGEPGMADRTVITRGNNTEVPLGGRICVVHRTFQQVKGLYSLDLSGLD